MQVQVSRDFSINNTA